LILGVIFPILGGIVKSKLENTKESGKEVAQDQVITFLVGVIFGCGLLVSGMVRRVNIITFLGLNDGWNPSLLFVLGCGVGVNFITFNYMIRVKYFWHYLGKLPC
jgi:hypothetical protein